MSLLQLLSAGRTLIGSGQSVGRYRVDTRYRLPKFGSAKNPFAQPTEAKPAAQVEMQMPDSLPKVQEEKKSSEVQKVQLMPEEIRAAKLEKTQRIPAVSAHKSPDPLVQPVEGKLHPLLALLDWMELTAVHCKLWLVNLNLRKLNPAKFDWAKLNPMKLLPKRQPVGVSVVTRAGSVPLQAELSLEKVRVLRNDLSDADLEIVPVGISQSKPARETRKAAKKIETEPELVGVEA